MNLIENTTLTVRQVATDNTNCPVIGDSTIMLAGWKCALVYEDATFRIYRVVGCSHTSGSNSDKLATGVRVYKRSLVIGSWLLECWTHGLEDNPQMDETFAAWFKRRTAPEPKRTTKSKPRSDYPTYAKPERKVVADYPSYAKPAPVKETDELAGMVGDVGQRVVKKL